MPIIIQWAIEFLHLFTPIFHAQSVQYFIKNLNQQRQTQNISTTMSIKSYLCHQQPNKKHIATNYIYSETLINLKS